MDIKVINTDSVENLKNDIKVFDENGNELKYIKKIIVYTNQYLKSTCTAEQLHNNKDGIVVTRIESDDEHGEWCGILTRTVPNVKYTMTPKKCL